MFIVIVLYMWCFFVPLTLVVASAEAGDPHSQLMLDHAILASDPILNTIVPKEDTFTNLGIKELNGRWETNVWPEYQNVVETVEAGMMHPSSLSNTSLNRHQDQIVLQTPGDILQPPDWSLDLRAQHPRRVVVTQRDLPFRETHMLDHGKLDKTSQQMNETDNALQGFSQVMAQLTAEQEGDTFAQGKAGNKFLAENKPVETSHVDADKSSSPALLDNEDAVQQDAQDSILYHKPSPGHHLQDARHTPLLHPTGAHVRNQNNSQPLWRPTVTHEKQIATSSGTTVTSQIPTAMTVPSETTMSPHDQPMWLVSIARVTVVFGIFAVALCALGMARISDSLSGRIPAKSHSSMPASQKYFFGEGRHLNEDCGINLKEPTT